MELEIKNEQQVFKEIKIMKTKKLLLLVFFLSLVTQFSFGQVKKITGTVTDGAQALPGVNIIVKGTSNGVQTDFNGRYSIDAQVGSTLIFSYVGMRTIEVIVPDRTVMNVTLESDNTLNEVVVVAYGTQSKKKLVQSISVVGQDELEDLRVVSPQEMLQGQASGVQVINSSGVLGASTAIRIRGTASISSGGQPLIVIDGVPVNDGIIVDGGGAAPLPLNPLADIDPSTIESFSVLKDAAAAAIYGSRGSNGVILITTKKGKKNQNTRVNINSSTSWSKLTDIHDVMNGTQFNAFRSEFASAIYPFPTPPGFFDEREEFDWIDGVTRKGFSKDISFDISGGNEKTTYFLGGSYKDEEGFIVGNSIKRYGIRLNLAHDVNDWLQVGANIGLTDTYTDLVPTGLASGVPITIAQLYPPHELPRDADGNFLPKNPALGNVIATEALNKNDLLNYRTLGNIFAEIDLFKNIKYKTDFGVDIGKIEVLNRVAEFNSAGTRGFASNSIDQQKRFTFTNTLNYNTTFNNEHSINATVGMSFENFEVKSLGVSGNDFLSDDLINVVSSEVSTRDGANSRTESNLFGLFARGGYNYKGKYIFEGSIRRDGSSKFGKNNRYGNFWAIAGGWIISEEDFMQNLNWVNFLKLKVNYGTSGNDRIGNFSFLAGFGTTGYNGAQGVSQLSAANPDLKWEKSNSFDAGLEFRLFNRLNLNLDYYVKRTEDLILNQPIPFTNGGIGSILKNVGNMENRGVDLDISVDVFKNVDFTWRSSLNLGFNKNEVLSLPGASKDDQGREFIGTGISRIIQGLSVNTIVLPRYVGVNSETGHAEWLDANDNPTTNYDQANRVVVGNGDPDFTGGFTNNFRYKNFNLNFLFNFSVGNDIYLDNMGFLDNAAVFFANQRTAVLNIWRQPGDINAHVPSATSPTFYNYTNQSTRYLKDGSYARLKNITLSYNLPKKISNEIGFTKVKLYTSARNVLTIKSDELKGIDPELTTAIGNTGVGVLGYSPPQSKSYTLGITLTF